MDGDVIAVSAFLNYEQIPILIDDGAYQPLFVQREANSWQTLPVEIQLPSEAGEYELLIFARSDAFE